MPPPATSAREHLLHELGTAFAARLELDELIPLVVRRCPEALDAEGASVLLLDEDGTHLRFPYVSAEAEVAKRCAAFGRGACKVIGFPGELCVALVHYRSGRLRASYTGGGRTYPEAQQTAMKRCQDDRGRSGRRCQHRTALCGDGR